MFKNTYKLLNIKKEEVLLESQGILEP